VVTLISSETVAAATLLAAIHPRAEGEVFNVGTGIETSVNALAAAGRGLTAQRGAPGGAQCASRTPGNSLA
jgi:nucleoside-diphosphate-sugar epimerase